MHSVNIGLNRPKLEFKRKGVSIETPVNPTILKPDTNIIGKFLKILSINKDEMIDAGLPDSRRACIEAETRRDFFVGTAMTYVRRDR